MVALIAAMSKDGCIGKANGLPWKKMRTDMKFFKSMTLNSVVIMGRKTFESMGSKPLPQRDNVIITSNPDSIKADNVTVVTSLENALVYGKEKSDQIYIIGGGNIYEQAIEFVDTMFITMVNVEIPDGDVYFPNIDHITWPREIINHGEADEFNEYDYTIYHIRKLFKE
jgi:dihydrofolate reductase